MFGLIKRSTHEAAIAERDEARKIAEQLKSRLTDTRRQVEALRADLLATDKLNAQLQADLASKSREVRIVGAALNEALTERDALKAAAEARRAKQLANLRNQPKQQPAH